MADLNKLGLADARDALRKGDVTSAELTAACLSAIEGAGALNAFVHHTGDLAMDQAKAADARIKSGDAPAMCGLPIGIKDLTPVAGVRTTWGTPGLADFVPEASAPLVLRLEARGGGRLATEGGERRAIGDVGDALARDISSTRGLQEHQLE